MGSVRPHSPWKAKRKAQMAGKIISPPKSILLTFFRFSCGPDLTCVRVCPAVDLPWRLVGRHVGITGSSRALFRRASQQGRSEEYTSELQSQSNLVCRLLLEKKNSKDG